MPPNPFPPDPAPAAQAGSLWDEEEDAALASLEFSRPRKMSRSMSAAQLAGAGGLAGGGGALQSERPPKGQHGRTDGCRCLHGGRAGAAGACLPLAWRPAATWEARLYPGWQLSFPLRSPHTPG